MRATGAVIGASFGLVLLVAGALFGSPASMESTIGYGLPTLVLGGVLGWTFAPRAAVGDYGAAMSTAAEITCIAVPLGALGVAASLIGVRFLTGEVQGGAFEALAGTVFVALVGLILLGLPLAGITFVVGSVWVGLLRLAAGRLYASRA